MLKQNPKNIIVRMPNWIGDLVMATPVLEALKKKFPEASLTVMCQGALGELLEKDPHVDEVFSFHKGKTFWRRFADRSVILRLRQGRYDLGVLLTNSFSSAWLFWRGHIENRLGFKGHWRSGLVNMGIPFPEKRKSQHLVGTYVELLKPLGIELHVKPALYVDEGETKNALSFLKRFGIEEGAQVVGMNPGAAYGEAKCWLPDRFTEVAKQMIARGAYVVFFGDSSAKELVNSICAGLGERAVNLAGLTSLRELMALIHVCKVFLTNDSGPMHIADALGVPVVALFGSTDPVVTGPYGRGKIIQKPVSCAPCFKRVCPIDFRCMKRIEVDEVVNALTEKMSGTN